MLLALWILPALITAFACLYIYLEMVKHGADAARAQRWRDRFVPVLFFGIAISLSSMPFLPALKKTSLRSRQTIPHPYHFQGAHSSSGIRA